MDARFNLSVISVIIIAVVVGIVAGRSQPKISAAPVPTTAPTPFPTPLPNHLDIVPGTSRNASAFYAPTTLTVRVGQTVTWVNTDSTDHAVVSDNAAFDSNVLAPGQSFRWKATHPGSYPYGDYLHPELRGAVLVQP
jgi:plastocyanin